MNGFKMKGMGMGIIGWLTFSATAWGRFFWLGEEWLAITDAVEPNILFVVDLSNHMQEPCAYGGDGDVDDDDNPCIDDVATAIDKLTQHYDWARYGIVGTASTESDDGFTKIAPWASLTLNSPRPSKTLTTTWTPTTPRPESRRGPRGVVRGVLPEHHGG